VQWGGSVNEKIVQPVAPGQEKTDQNERIRRESVTRSESIFLSNLDGLSHAFYFSFQVPVLVMPARMMV
jgi:hypothetical protein